jgi:hypothetical protein
VISAANEAAVMDAGALAFMVDQCRRDLVRVVGDPMKMGKDVAEIGAGIGRVILRSRCFNRRRRNRSPVRAGA